MWLNRNQWWQHTARLMLLLLAMLFAPGQALAAATDAQTAASPYLLVQDIGQQLFKRLATMTPAQRQQRQLMATVVEQELMPYIDYRYAALKIMGNYVKSASNEQRQAFIDNMRSYLVNTYAGALVKYKKQQVHYQPDRPVNGKHIVTVRTEIIEEGAPTINIDFIMRQSKKNGEWLAFDMIVEGISMISSKQAEIAKKIQRDGLDSTIAQLKSDC